MSDSLSSSESGGLKSSLKNVPVLSGILTWMIRMIRMPGRFTELSSRFDRLEADLRLALRDGKANTEEAKSQIAYLTRDLEMLHHALKEKAGLNQTETVKAIANHDFSSETYLYFAFENKFRGAREEILKTQMQYIKIIEDARKVSKGEYVLDAGCGRGEFLKLLRDHGIAAKGADSTPSMIEACRQEKLDAVVSDLLAYLKNVAEGTLLGITAFQVVEHLPVEYLIEFIKAARSKLAPGGVLILETVNPDSLSSFKNFYLDLTHQNPIPSATLKFLVENAGFKDAEIKFTSEIPASSKLQGSDPNILKLNQLLFGPQDYAVVGRR